MASKQRGETLISALMSILIFSVGIMAVLGLMTTVLIETSNTQYRVKANEIASNTISMMWLGDRSVAKLKENYAQSEGEGYKIFFALVKSSLPGTTIEKNKPSIDVDNKGLINISIKWQRPSDLQSHKITMSTFIAE